jgi:heme a synthase
VLAVCTFLLLIAGALVTSNDAGLAVPDWPTSFGHWPVTYGYFRVPMVGGTLYEHGHRMIAQLIGILTIVLAIWTQKTDERPWMRKVAWAALGLVIAQGIVGGLTVLFYLPWAVSTAHAALGQTFFSLTVAMALMTSRSWIESEPMQLLDSHHPRLHTLTLVACAAVYVQLIFGAGFRHNGMKLVPHLVGAVAVTIILVWTVTRVLSEHSQHKQLWRPAMLLLWLILVQLTLGFIAWMTRVVWYAHAPQPMLPAVLATVAHVVNGALVLATTVVLAIQTQRHVALRPLLVLSPESGKVATA